MVPDRLDNGSSTERKIHARASRLPRLCLRQSRRPTAGRPCTGRSGRVHSKCANAPHHRRGATSARTLLDDSGRLRRARLHRTVHSIGLSELPVAQGNNAVPRRTRRPTQTPPALVCGTREGGHSPGNRGLHGSRRLPTALRCRCTGAHLLFRLHQHLP